jgi:hypothetical protein
MRLFRHAPRRPAVLSAATTSLRLRLAGPLADASALTPASKTPAPHELPGVGRPHDWAENLRFWHAIFVRLRQLRRDHLSGQTRAPIGTGILTHGETNPHRTKNGSTSSFAKGCCRFSTLLLISRLVASNTPRTHLTGTTPGCPPLGRLWGVIRPRPTGACGKGVRTFLAKGHVGLP